MLSNIYCKIMLFPFKGHLSYSGIYICIDLFLESCFYPIILSVFSILPYCLNYTLREVSMSCRVGNLTMNFFKSALTTLSPLHFHIFPLWNQAGSLNFNLFSRISFLNAIKQQNNTHTQNICKRMHKTFKNRFGFYLGSIEFIAHFEENWHLYIESSNSLTVFVSPFNLVFFNVS